MREKSNSYKICSSNMEKLSEKMEEQYGRMEIREIGRSLQQIRFSKLAFRLYISFTNLFFTSQFYLKASAVHHPTKTAFEAMQIPCFR